MTAFDAVTPTLGSVAQSYEYIVDVAPVPVGAAPKNYRNVPDINQFNPQFAAQLQDITTYANKGQQAQTKVGSAPTAAFNILKIRDALGDFQPEWQILKTASDKSGKDNLVYLRWYDALGAADAYEGLFLVSRDNRPENGPQGPGWDAFTFTAAGPIVPIVNPVKSGSKTGWTVQVTGTPPGGTYQLTLNGTPTSNLA
ncbi:phage tail tube protein, partial [uncultured Microbacterium sp.]|uniref:phage tail tube protein n=1 Tax=uncultured Microbacterium sp. TaxID=191216 RepID=UPI0025F699C1